MAKTTTTGEIRIHLINPANVQSGFAIMTPRCLPVLAAATPPAWQSRLVIHDLAVDPLEWRSIRPDDLVGVSLHTLNANRGYRLISEIKRRGHTKVVAGGVHATIFPEEALIHGADAVVTGDGEAIWPEVVEDFAAGRLRAVYQGGRVPGDRFTSMPRWDLLNHRRYMMATVQTTRGCPENCTFCSVWRTDGRDVRFRIVEDTIEEVNALYRLGFRVIVLADDNFYAVGSKNEVHRGPLLAERMELMRRLETQTPSDMKFLTQTTLRTADDTEFMRAMHRAKIRGVLVGIEAIDAGTLKSIHKGFNQDGHGIVAAVERLQRHGIYVLGSFIVGLGMDRRETFPRMLDVAHRSGMALAQFVQYTCFPGTVDYELLMRHKHVLTFKPGREAYWLSHTNERSPVTHPTLSDADLREAMSSLWGGFYATPMVLQRGWRLGMRPGRWLFAYWAFCQFYKRVYSQYGLSADSARTIPVGGLTRWLGERALRALKAPATVNLAKGLVLSCGTSARAETSSNGRRVSVE